MVGVEGADVSISGIREEVLELDLFNCSIRDCLGLARLLSLLVWVRVGREDEEEDEDDGGAEGDAWSRGGEANLIVFLWLPKNEVVSTTLIFGKFTNLTNKSMK